MAHKLPRLEFRIQIIFAAHSKRNVTQSIYDKLIYTRTHTASWHIYNVGNAKLISERKRKEGEVWGSMSKSKTYAKCAARNHSILLGWETEAAGKEF